MIYLIAWMWFWGTVLFCVQVQEERIIGRLAAFILWPIILPIFVFIKIIREEI